MGLYLSQQNADNAWAQDLELIFTNLQVINNNSASSIGGGGTPSQPLAPPFCLETPCDLSTSVSEVGLVHQFELFPNPTNGLIQIKWNTDNFTLKECRYEIHNHLGQLILIGNLDFTSNQEVNVPGPSGIYFLTLENIDGIQITKRFIKN